MAQFPEYEGIKPAVLIKATLDTLFNSGDIFEVRIPKARMGTISGYFNDSGIAATLIAKENGKHPAIYVTANPVTPALIARNSNKFEYGSQTTTNDAEIHERRWFLVDLDPIRPAGISSTNGELELAHRKAKIIKDWLASQGWPDPHEATSGNGAHLMYAVREPNDEPTRQIFENATKMLATLFSDETVSVDTTMWNASRVWKIYGTLAAKGSNTPERPHRVARFTKVVEEPRTVERSQLETLANALMQARAEEFKDMTGEYIGDMVRWLSDRGQTVTSGPRPMFGSEGKKWTLSRCAFNPQHVGPIVGLVANRPVYRCLHNSCSAYRWKEYREKIDPNFKDPDVVRARLLEWCMGEGLEPDPELLETASRTGKKLAQIMAQVKKEAPRARFLLLEDALKVQHKKFLKETIGENNEKGNIVGLINRTKNMQEEGLVPPFWIADFDNRARVGEIGDPFADRAGEQEEIALLVKFHSLGDTWVKQTHCGQIIKHIAAENRINPLKRYFSQFRWDGVKRLDTWLPEYLGTKDTSYTRAIGRKWLISAVARGMEPGCQADHMLILEGKQGIGKSQALRIIGGPFYVEFSRSISSHSTNEKDLVATMIGKLILEMSELATVKRADIETLKSTISKTHDDVRLAYERDSRAYPRTCVFAGTTNEVGQAYIADATGARRFWPTIAGECGPVKIAALKEIRDQLWAEAIEAYDNGEDWYRVPEEEVAAEQEARQLTVEGTDPWYSKLRESMTNPDNYSANVFAMVQRFTSGQEIFGEKTLRAGSVSDILSITLGVPVERQTPNDVTRVRNIMRVMGFKRVRPSGGWQGQSYTYDLNKEAMPHLWPAIESAYKSSKSEFTENVE